VLHSAPSYSIKKLQRVQNNAARIVLEAPRRSHVSPLLRTLHWLPVQQRIDYKVALLTFKVRRSRSTSTTSYLRLLIQDREHGHNLRLVLGRIFSKAGEIVNRRRASLKPSTVDMLLLLSKNLKVLDEN